MLSWMIDSLEQTYTGPFMPCVGIDIAVICSSCGKLWAKIFHKGTDWRGFTYPCTHCKPWPFAESIPGSILGFLATDALDFLPEEVLRREFFLTLDFMEKLHETETKANPAGS